MGPLLEAVLFLKLQKLELSIKYAVWFLLKNRKNYSCMHLYNNQNRIRRQLSLESTKGKGKILEKYG